MRRVKVVTAAGALALALTACASSETSGSSSSGVTTPSTAASSPSPGSATSSAGSSSSTSTGATSTGSAQSNASGEAGLPSGTVRQTASKTGISFAAPKGWRPINASAVNDPAARKAMEPLAKRAGVPLETIIKRFVEQSDLVLIDTDAKWGFANNLNVTSAPVAGLPRKGDLDATLSRFGATAGEFEDVTTPLGPAVMQHYTLVSSGQTVHGRMMVVPTGGSKGGIVTISAASDSDADRVAKTILSTLQKAS